MSAEQAIASRYIVGAIVPADRLVGRDAFFHEIRRVWAKPGPRKSLVVFGPRRMGKTSAMRSIVKRGAVSEDTAVAYLTLQTIDWGEGLVELCHGCAHALWSASGRGLATPEIDTFASSPLVGLHRFFGALSEAEQQRRFILVLDEYELLDGCLPERAAASFVAMLADLSGDGAFLALALVGLRDLYKRLPAIYSPLAGSRSIRVSFLDPAETTDAVQQGIGDPRLSYSREVLSRIYDLTGGQPFLVQIVGARLLDLLNARAVAGVAAQSATVADVESLVADGSVLSQGASYFRGVWALAGEEPPGQREILRVLAACPMGMNLSEIHNAISMNDCAERAAEDALAYNGAIDVSDRRWRISSELLRIWIESESCNDLVDTI